MAKQTVPPKGRPPPLEVWIRGLDGDPENPPDIKERMAKLGSALMVALIDEQRRLSVSTQKMASWLGVDATKYGKDCRRLMKGDGVPHMQAATLCNIVNREQWSIRIREIATVLLRHKVYVSQGGTAAATSDMPSLTAAFGEVANYLFCGSQLPAWIVEIDTRDIASWNAVELALSFRDKRPTETAGASSSDIR